MINQDKWAELERELLGFNRKSWEEREQQRVRDHMLKVGLVFMAIVIVIVLLLVASSHGSELPPAPHLSMRHDPIEFYPADQRMIVHNYPNGRTIIEPPRLIDWSFVLGHGIYAGASAFDRYETAKYVGSCAWEANGDLGSNPSNRALVVNGVVEAAAVVGGDLLLRYIGRRNGFPKWMNAVNGNMAAAIGAGKHIHGGVSWQRLCN